MFDSIGICLTENKLQKQDHKVRTADEPKEGRIMEAGQGARYQRSKKKKILKKICIYYWCLSAG